MQNLEQQADAITEEKIALIRAERESFAKDLVNREKEYEKDVEDLEREIQRILVGQAEFSDPAKTDQEIVSTKMLRIIV